MGKKRKISRKSKAVPDPYSGESRKTERSAAAVLMHWMRDIIQEKGLDLGLPDVDTIADDRKSPDIIIYESRRGKKVLCLLEAKLPRRDLFDPNLREEARSKASKRKAKYFGTTNFKGLAWFNTQKANEGKPEEEQLVEKYALSEIEDLNQLDQGKYAEPTKRQLEKFLTRLHAIHTGQEAEPRHPVDEFLVFRLHEKIRTLSGYYSQVTQNAFHKDKKFRNALRDWFNRQGWDFHDRPEFYERVARQTAYLLVNKILFYNTLQAKRPDVLNPLEIPENLTKGDVLKKFLSAYFEQVLKIDYEEIFSTDFIDTLAFPDVKEVVAEIRDLVNLLKRYDFSKLGFDVLGRVFERLIPETERHNLGQYFTNADVVDIILRFCLKHEDDKVLDPGCGAGTFLVRAYQHKKIMNQRLDHESLLDTLWGIDISRFPAHLATINLAIKDLGVEKNYPNILCEDFFSFQPLKGCFDPDEWRRARASTLGIAEISVPHPRSFDVVVGNPPYTRQEEIHEIASGKETYKDQMIHNALHGAGRTKLANIGRRAGIHAYFFVHGTKFLCDGGRFGFVVSNSWLDVDYGKGLQEFFLKNYKIIAIIESKVERWFADAAINTCIVILEKCKEPRKRDANIVRFVYLKKPLSHLMPPAQDVWEKQVERIRAVDQIKRTILAHVNLYENEDVRIFPKLQKELLDEGIDKSREKFVGGKWGIYVRTLKPDIYSRILGKCRDRLIPLGMIAKDVRPGCYTGINDFFYVERDKSKRDTIEKAYLRRIIRTTKQISKPSIEVSKLDTCVLCCPKSKSELKELKHRGALSYINWGERQRTRKRQKVPQGIPWPKVETVKNRQPGWWSIPEKDIRPARLFMIYVVSKRFIVACSDRDVASDRCLHRIFLPSSVSAELMAAILNCTLTLFFIESFGRSNLGLGALKFETADAKRIHILDPTSLSRSETTEILKVFSTFRDRPIGDIFAEIGAGNGKEPMLQGVRPERRALDKIIMSDILGLTDEEQLEVYRAVVDLVKSRLERAKSIANSSLPANEIEGVKEEIVERMKKSDLS